jgi:hypothetical protein
MLRAIVRNEHQPHPDPRLQRLRRDIVHQTVVDFRCVPPRRVIIARPAPDSTDKDAFDILPFFLKDPEFAGLFAHYRSVGRGKALDLYDLATPLEHPSPSSCRRGA